VIGSNFNLSFVRNQDFKAVCGERELGSMSVCVCVF
jgi:hypothetical protein